MCITTQFCWALSTVCGIGLYIYTIFGSRGSTHIFTWWTVIILTDTILASVMKTNQLKVTVVPNSQNIMHHVSNIIWAMGIFQQSCSVMNQPLSNILENNYLYSHCFTYTVHCFSNTMQCFPTWVLITSLFVTKAEERSFKLFCGSEVLKDVDSE